MFYYKNINVNKYSLRDGFFFCTAYFGANETANKEIYMSEYI